MTIYRWWSNKAALAMEAFFHATSDDLAFRGHAKASEDFSSQILHLAEFLRGPTGAVLAAMVAGAKSDPILAQAVREQWVAPQTRSV